MSANILDRLIAWIAPERGARRVMARARIEAAKGYFDGATIGRRGASIRRSAADANVISRRNLPKLRAGSRDLVRNNPHARRAVEAIVSNTIGSGISPQFMRGDERAEDIESLADDFLETTECDVEGRHDYRGLQALAMQSVVESGEVLVRRRRRRRRDGLTVPIQYQVLESDYLDHSKDGPTERGGRIIQGVEYDAIGRRRAYWLHSEHPGGDRFSFESKPVSAEDVVHIYRTERPGQVRGIPWAAPVMLRLADFADYEDAQLVRQKIAACFVGFVSEPFGNISPMGVEEDDGKLIDSFEPGILERLPPGAEIKFGDPPTVEDYEEYVRVSIRAIAAGFGVSYEALSGDLSNTNFASGKMGRLEFQRNIDRWQHLMFIPQFCDPMTRWFLEAAELQGEDVDGVSTRHIAPRKEMVDPTKELRAEKDAIRSGQKTLTQVIRESGRDPVEHLTELAKDFALLDELDLVLDSDPRQRSDAGQPVDGNGGGGGGDQALRREILDALEEIQNGNGRAA